MNILKALKFLKCARFKNYLSKTGFIYILTCFFNLIKNNQKYFFTLMGKVIVKFKIFPSLFENLFLILLKLDLLGSRKCLTAMHFEGKNPIPITI